jgi:hypothetical protein
MELLFKVSSSNIQGAACFGDYLFQFTSQNQSPNIHGVFIINLRNKVVEEYVDLGFDINFHNSNASFGKDYYHEGDLFPILYLSENYAPNNYYKIHAYRILVNNDGNYSFHIVQNIEMPDLKYMDNMLYPHAFIVNENNTLWIEGVSADNKTTIYKEFHTPSLSEGDCLIPYNCLLRSVYIPREDVTDQSYLICENRSYQIMGFTEDALLCIINLLDNAVERVFHFRDFGIQKEPEGIFIWDGRLCVSFHTGEIYALNFVESFDLKESPSV